MQNLRLVYPAATDDEIIWAAQMAGIYEDIAAMPNGFQTRISHSQSNQLPAGFRQRIGLARAVLKPAPIVILDEPGNGLDDVGEAALERCIEWLRGRATLLIVSHRPSHMRMADTTIFMEHGSISHIGPFDSIKDKIFSRSRDTKSAINMFTKFTNKNQETAEKSAALGSRQRRLLSDTAHIEDELIPGFVRPMLNWLPWRSPVFYLGRPDAYHRSGSRAGRNHYYR